MWKRIFRFLIIIILIILIISLKRYNIYNKNSRAMYNLNRVVVVGDSRMYLIDKNKKELNIPDNYIFIAKSGARINWLKDYALNKTYRILENKDNNYKYKVIFNLGVNDIIHFEDSNPNEIATNYFDTYIKLIDYFDDVDFYFLSVNPVDSNQNEKIKVFNTYISKLIYNKNQKNIHYCDTYSNINFKTYDQVHYLNETNIDIINYIDRYCIKSLPI